MNGNDIKFKPYTYEVTETVEKMYPYGIKIPEEGFEVTGEFRPPKKNEYWLSFPNSNLVFQASEDYVISEPAVILRKKKEYTDKDILEFVLTWLHTSVAYNAITSSSPFPSKGPWSVYKQLVSGSFGGEDTEELKKVIIAEMRLKGV